MTLLVLYFHSDNLGDPAIGECTAALIRQAYPQARVLLQDMLDRPPSPGRPTLPNGAGNAAGTGCGPPPPVWAGTSCTPTPNGAWPTTPRGWSGWKAFPATG